MSGAAGSEAIAAGTGADGVAAGAPLVFSRPTPAGVRATFALLVAASFLVPPGAAALVLALLRAGPPWLVAAVDWVGRGPFGLLPALGTLGALLLLGLVMDKLYQAHARRRFGRCELQGEELLFEHCLGGGEERVPLGDVTGFAATPEGLLLQVHGRGALARWTRPLLVPAAGEAELSAALRALEAPRPEPPGAASFGRGRPGWAWALGPLVVLPLAYAALGLVAARQGIELAGLLALPLLGGLVLGLYLAERWVLGPRWTPIHLGRAALLCERERIPWTEVERIGWSGDELALERGATRVRARVVPRQAEARALLARRLLTAGARAGPDGPLPAWAGSAARARERAWVLLLLLGLPAAVAALALPPLPLWRELRLGDDEGATLCLVHRISDDEPRLLSLAQGEAGEPPPRASLVLRDLFGTARFGGAEELVLDLLAGRTLGPGELEGALAPATRLHRFEARTGHLASEARLPAALTARVRQAAQAGQAVESLAALLDEVPGLPAEDPVLAAWLEGRAGRRTFAAEDRSGWRLVWGAERGEVLFCVLAAPGAPVEITLAGCFHQLPGPGAVVAVWDETLPLARVDAGGRVLGFPGPLPAREHLLEVGRALRGGATLAQASRELRELLEARGPSGDGG